MFSTIVTLLAIAVACYATKKYFNEQAKNEELLTQISILQNYARMPPETEDE